MVRGEVWLVRFDPTVGDEIGKTRPAVIVSDDRIGILRLKLIVPITAWNDAFSGVQWMVRIDPSAENGLIKLSAADTFQLSSLSLERFVRKLGRLSDTAMQEIAETLAFVLSIDS
jgi:mRNA interferase MazF